MGSTHMIAIFFFLQQGVQASSTSTTQNKHFTRNSQLSIDDTNKTMDIATYDPKSFVFVSPPPKKKLSEEEIEAAKKHKNREKHQRYYQKKKEQSKVTYGAPPPSVITPNPLGSGIIDDATVRQKHMTPEKWHRYQTSLDKQSQIGDSTLARKLAAQDKVIAAANTANQQ